MKNAKGCAAYEPHRDRRLPGDDGDGTVTLRIVPVDLKTANRFVLRLHRHSSPVVGHKFAVAVADPEGTLRGVAIVGRPVAPRLDDGNAVEITRVCTDGTRNACSMLYGAAGSGWIRTTQAAQQPCGTTAPDELSSLSGTTLSAGSGGGWGDHHRLQAGQGRPRADDAGWRALH